MKKLLLLGYLFLSAHNITMPARLTRAQANAIMLLLGNLGYHRTSPFNFSRYLIERSKQEGRTTKTILVIRTGKKTAMARISFLINGENTDSRTIDFDPKKCSIQNLGKTLEELDQTPIISINERPLRKQNEQDELDSTSSKSPSSPDWNL